MLFTLARSGVYEAAIMGGQFFLFAGLCSTFAGVHKLRPWLLVLSGIFWTLAIGCRISLLPAIAVMVAVTVWRIWHMTRVQLAEAPRFKAIAGLCAPLAIGGIVFAWYNYDRFHSIFEFGTSYLLAGAPTHRLGSSDFFTFGHILPNLYRYFLESPVWQKQFPFILADHDNQLLYARFHLTKDYAMEPLTGIVWTQPFLLLAFLSLPWPLINSPDSEPAPGFHSDRSMKVWIVASLISAVVLGIAPALALVLSTMRYLMDITPALSVLACIGFWQALRTLAKRPALKASLCVFVILIILLQTTVGLLMGINGYLKHLEMHNYALYAKLAHFFKF